MADRRDSALSMPWLKELLNATQLYRHDVGVQGGLDADAVNETRFGGWKWKERGNDRIVPWLELGRSFRS